ncbi:carbohydrate ABC transporter substrate-binding protein, CUT1 family [Collimonas sp. OK607]|uniref:ABC transporter substrate-binding protein n=1 Tax=Collimonas sp. OK607 TaxID=1798194 RepID=UPI0008E8468D|nr:ABC transporter substrate-binding protein [Collimonas sp. OK607]SFB16796.1 carbohydrate ABC transporter substrate-binding protein, CUT1 family [Collimonas sp. OK607]
MFRHISGFAAALFLAAICVTGASAATITIACGPTSGPNFEFCKRHADAWAKKTGNTINVFSAPITTTDTLALYRQMFAAQSADIDVMMIDVTSPGTLKDHLVDLKPYAKGAELQHFPSIITNNTVDGRLLGMPWYADAALLYYRKDLLEKYKLNVPKTWDDFAATAKKIQAAERGAGNADFQGFVFQAKAYEGLTCNTLEWFLSFGGGTFVDNTGKITINNPGGIKALNTAASWIGTIAPTGVLNYGEEDARGVFQNGKALFMRNWGYALKLVEAADSPVKGKVGLALLPKGSDASKTASTLGGRELAVSKYSRNIAASADLVMYMTSAEVEKDRAVRGSYIPTRPELFKDKDVLASNPFMANIYAALMDGGARPSTVTAMKYPEVSNTVWIAAHDVLSKKVSAEESLKKAEAKLNQIKRNKW